jgi:transcriptional regulator with GAF, ATPase, and Fis domain
MPHVRSAGTTTSTESTMPISRLPTLRVASATLHVIAGPDEGKSIRLGPGSTRVGTGTTCRLRIGDPTVSRLHCEVHVDGDRVRVTDSGSTNGTTVDGVRIAEAWLAPGSLIRVGNTAIRVEIGDERLTITLSPRESFGPVIGASPEMRRVYAIMDHVAPVDATVLIQGETGTGKEVVARAIHEASKRASRPFVAIHCGALAENLIESELFGHVRGAFAGATADRVGLFEHAHGGTLFLDEIGELPPALQPKLLRAIETREVRPVGGNTPKKLDVRLLAATHRSLAASVNDGTFRDDLYYRLAVFEIDLPPLRSRREDIPRLANHFYAHIIGGDEPLPQTVLDDLALRPWPGNVRELRNFVERTACFGWSSTRGEGAPAAEASPVPVLEGLLPYHLPLKEARAAWIAQFESLYLTALLRREGGNVTRAAAAAGVNRRYLHRLINEHAIRGFRGEKYEDKDEEKDEESDAG